MKNKTDLRCWGGTIRKILLVVMLSTVCAMAAIAFRAYCEQMELVAERATNEKLLNHIMEAEQIHALLCRADTGDINSLREVLQLRFDDKIIRVHSLLGEMDDDTRAVAENLFSKFANDRKIHPERYVSTQNTKFQDERVLRVFAHSRPNN
ncbi:hypothetical protein [Pedosphaera parvula]|uniref:Uncharacterized protein n=1 Tax=Pedosphaera parvula (strain Ellin514) TaxID=320771 RepID=B9XK24_PEDPL|nr:hypothetical protein [Pedosphaera parvula]EEF59847.1 hypothetical protein Cflav_PD2854 [Pedosphaera parvula Ellin514]